MRKIWHNGKILDETEAKISVYDSALMFGDMVFEMTRYFNKKHFKLREHLERLYRSMKYVHIDCDMTIEQMERACHEVTIANENEIELNDEHRLMINVSRGILSIYSGVTGLKDGPNVMITDFPLRWTVSGFGRYYDEGINAVITNQRAIPAKYLEPKIKHRSRLYLQMANIEAAQMRGKNNWALLLDGCGNIAEGSGDNFFIIKNEILYTPEGRNILRGISRDYVFEICRKHNIECLEKNIETYDVLDADEAFMTGTPFCMLPVCKINSRPIGTGKMGLLTQTLLRWWGESVGVDIAGQIKGWNSDNNDSVTPYRFKR